MGAGGVNTLLPADLSLQNLILFLGLFGVLWVSNCGLGKHENSHRLTKRENLNRLVNTCIKTIFLVWKGVYFFLSLVVSKIVIIKRPQNTYTVTISLTYVEKLVLVYEAT